MLLNYNITDRVIRLFIAEVDHGADCFGRRLKGFPSITGSTDVRFEAGDVWDGSKHSAFVWSLFGGLF